MNFRYLFLTSLCVLTFNQNTYAQSTKDRSTDYAYLVASSDTVEVAYNQFTTISIAGNKDFSVKSNDEWITVQKISKTNLAIFCKANEQNQNRIGSVTLSTLDGKTNKSIKVRQLGKNAEYLIPQNTDYPSPIMGWGTNSNTTDVNANYIQQQANSIKKLGLYTVGYKYIRLDKNTFVNRKNDGQLTESSEKYPKGVKNTIDYLHENSFEVGIHYDGNMSDFAQKDCEYFFHTLGLDGMKADFTPQTNQELRNRVSNLNQAFLAIGRKDIQLGINSQAYPGTWIHELSHSCQTANNSANNWKSIRKIIKDNLYLSAYAYNGHYNDMDVLQLGAGLTDEEAKTHFGMWCMLNSPLLISNNVPQMNARILSLLKNKELIALNQRAISQQAYVSQHTNDCYVLVKDIDKNDPKSRAIAVYNPTDDHKNIYVAMNLLNLSGNIQVRDIINHKDLADTQEHLFVSVPAHGTQIYLLNAENRLEQTLYEAETAYIPTFQNMENVLTAKNGFYEADTLCSGGMKASNLGFNKDNCLVWNRIYSQEGGQYKITINYVSTEKREFTIEINNKAIKTIKTAASNGKLGSTSFIINLNKGNNVIRLLNATAAMPDIDALILKPCQTSQLFVEAENFNLKGGWKVDQQFMDIMGSPYLNAHGMGEPVADATTEIEIPSSQTYHVYVRTYNWTSPWTTKEGPGKFQISVDGKNMETVLGCKGNQWEWQYAGSANLSEGKHALALHDLTGFNGRVDAIYFNSEQVAPPSEVNELGKFRRSQLNIPNTPEIQEEFDLVVCGGGIAGMCAAMAAARQGLQVALINDRPVLGGNNSAEVRVHLGGRIEVGPYTNLGNLIKEFGHTKVGNAMPEANYEDAKKMDWIRSEKNIHLFLNNRVNLVHMNEDQIDYVISQDIETGVRTMYKAPLFIDCTGDGVVGALAGADYRMGREAKSEFGESKAPEVADNMTMGNSNQWYASTTNKKSTFPIFEYGVEFNESNMEPTSKGDWNWENGMRQDQITEHERIRDYGLMVVYSNWSYLKNKSSRKNEFANKKLTWVAFIGGKRESRRLMGDYILSGTDIINRNVQEDFTAGTSWTIDLHYPIQKNESDFKGEAFKSWADHVKAYSYPIPYRCLYSRNVSNLFMAGRNISVTHMALGTTRVMRTTGMIGEVVGLAASVCKKHNALPREVYTMYFKDLKNLMKKGAGKQGLPNNQTFNNGSWLTD